MLVAVVNEIIFLRTKLSNYILLLDTNVSNFYFCILFTAIDEVSGLGYNPSGCGSDLFRAVQRPQWSPEPNPFIQSTVFFSVRILRIFNLITFYYLYFWREDFLKGIFRMVAYSVSHSGKCLVSWELLEMLLAQG